MRDAAHSLERLTHSARRVPPRSAARSAAAVLGFGPTAARQFATHYDLVSAGCPVSGNGPPAAPEATPASSAGQLSFQLQYTWRFSPAASLRKRAFSPHLRL